MRGTIVPMDLLGMFLPLIFAALVLLVLATLIVSGADVNRTAPETDGGKIQFLPNRRSYFGVYLFVGFLSYVAIVSVFNGLRSQSDLISPLSCIGFVAMMLAAFPASIVADENGIEQVYWLRSTKRIAWNDISSVEVNEKKREIKIKSKSGVKIVHSRQLPDRARFLSELEKHGAKPATGPRVFAMSERNAEPQIEQENRARA